MMMMTMMMTIHHRFHPQTILLIISDKTAPIETNKEDPCDLIVLQTQTSIKV